MHSIDTIAARALEGSSALEPVIAADRDTSEADRRLAPAIVAGIREAGLQRLTLTAENGGLEVPLPVTLDIYEQLAGFDASVGWIVWNNCPALPVQPVSGAGRSSRDLRRSELVARIEHPAKRQGDFRKRRATGFPAAGRSFPAASWRSG